MTVAANVSTLWLLTMRCSRQVLHGAEAAKGLPEQAPPAVLGISSDQQGFPYQLSISHYAVSPVNSMIVGTSMSLPMLLHKKFAHMPA